MEDNPPPFIPSHRVFRRQVQNRGLLRGSGLSLHRMAACGKQFLSLNSLLKGLPFEPNIPSEKRPIICASRQHNYQRYHGTGMAGGSSASRSN